MVFKIAFKITSFLLLSHFKIILKIGFSTKLSLESSSHQNIVASNSFCFTSLTFSQQVWGDGVLVGDPSRLLRPSRVPDHLRPLRLHRRIAGHAAAGNEQEEDAGHRSRERTLQTRTKFKLQQPETKRQSLKNLFLNNLFLIATKETA